MRGQIVSGFLIVTIVFSLAIPVAGAVDENGLSAVAQPDPNLPATYGSVTLKSGFLPDPFRKPLVAGGEIKTKLGGVAALVTKAPDFSLHYTKGTLPLTFHVKSHADTTLLINLPDGKWIADDDSGGGLDPLIRINDPPSGRYDIYVGTYGPELHEATLYITERGFKKEPPPFKANLSDCYVLSAGVDNYPFLNKLKGDLNDAKNTVAAFKNQVGTKFRNVKVQTLFDGAATHQGILQGFQNFTKVGAPNDFMVLFLSGHGSRMNGNQTWIFCPFDFKTEDQGLTDKEILDVCDELAKQKKYADVIVDACFCGQMNVTAQPYFQQYKDANQGGIILMLACAGDQTSAAVGNFSTFARAFADAMDGGADLKKNGTMTLGDVQRYTKKRTDELVAEARAHQQDSIVAWTPSISKDMPFAYANKFAVQPLALAAAGASTHWEGKENLKGYGKLSFTMYENGRAVMADAKSTLQGVWHKRDTTYTLSFGSGSIVYTGTLNGAVLSGTAYHHVQRDKGKLTWKWSVNAK